MSNTCKKEEIQVDCGLNDDKLTTAIQCDDFPCEDNCEEVSDQECTLYYGDDIKEHNIKQGDSTRSIFEKLILFVNPNLSDTDSAINLKSTKITTKKIAVQWEGQNPNMYGYTVEIKNTVSGVITVSPLVITTNPDKYSYEFLNLSAGTSHEVVVKAYYVNPNLPPLPALVFIDSLTLIIKTLY